MKVELMGPPGSGKSTLADSLSDRYPTGVVAGQSGRDRCVANAFGLPYHMIPAPIRTRLLSRLWNHCLHDSCFTSFAESYPEFVSELLSVPENLPRNTDQYVSLFVTATARSWLFREHNPAELSIVDEGICHYAATAQLSPTGEQYVEALPLPELVLHIDAPAETCLERQDRRSHGRASILVDQHWEDAIAEIETQRELVAEATDYIRECGGHVLKVDAVQSIEEMETEVLQTLRDVEVVP